MEANTFTTLLQAFQIAIVTSLIFLAGLSSCLSLWIMPLTKLLPPTLAVKQFKQTFDWGGQYLLTSSRALGASLLITSILTSQSPDAVEADKWRVWAGCLCFLILVAPYEIYFIFPINDRADEIGLEMERGGVTEKREEELKKELKELLVMWQRRNFGRVVMPLITGVVGLMGVVRKGE